MSDSCASHIQTLEIEQRKLSRNLNSHNFSLECPIQAHHISRRAKLNNGSSREILRVISFHTDVRFGDIIYWDAWNEQRKLSRNSNGHKFSHECSIRGHNISRRSKLNNGSYRENRMVISFHTNVRFGDIIYRDARNWTTEAIEKTEWS